MTSTRQKTDPTSQHDAEYFACCVARLLADARCESVLLIDVRGLSQVTDFIVIASGTSERQMRSSVDDLKELGKEMGNPIYRHDGETDAQWVVVDFVNIMTHLLTPEHRVFYDLESLWGDAPRIDWAERTEPGQFAQIGTKRRLK